jgi:hypothetical protein
METDIVNIISYLKKIKIILKSFLCGSELILSAEDDDVWRNIVLEILLYHSSFTSSTRFPSHYSTHPTDFERHKKTFLPSLFRSNFELERRTKEFIPSMKHGLLGTQYKFSLMFSQDVN